MDNNKFYNIKLISIEKGFNLVIKCKKTQSILEDFKISIEILGEWIKKILSTAIP